MNYNNLDKYIMMYKINKLEEIYNNMVNNINQMNNELEKINQQINTIEEKKSSEKHPPNIHPSEKNN